MGRTAPVSVDLATDPDHALSAMAAFDASRARIFLTKPNVIEHVPRSLRVLRALSQTQDDLAGALRERAQQRRDALPTLPEIDVKTPAGKTLAEIEANSDLAALISLIDLTPTERTRLEELELAAAAIRTDQSRQLEAAARTLATNVRSAAQRLANADTQLSTKEVTELADLRRQLDDVNAGERALADRAFADQRFEGTGRGPWREMWHAAERFAEAADTTFPDPGQDAACPLCQQDIDASARERLGRFKEFVTSDLRQKATDLGDQIEEPPTVSDTLGSPACDSPHPRRRCHGVKLCSGRFVLRVTRRVAERGRDRRLDRRRGHHEEGRRSLEHRRDRTELCLRSWVVLLR
jgi:hypothetical protein